MIRRALARRRSDEGSAVVEFIIVGIAVLVPMVYVVQCAMTVHAAALASSQAVREAGRAFSTAATEAQGRERASIAGRLAFADQGLALPPGALRDRWPRSASIGRSRCPGCPPRGRAAVGEPSPSAQCNESRSTTIEAARR
jgi:hypothetical protein